MSVPTRADDRARTRARSGDRPAPPLSICIASGGTLKAVFGPCGPNAITLPLGAGAPGPAGSPGLPGPPGPAGRGLSVADATGRVVGRVVDVVNGFVIRQSGADRVLVQTTAQGVVQSAISFAHGEVDCSGPRYLPNLNGAGLVFYGLVSGSTIVYTRLVDPTYAVALPTRAVETFAAGQPLTTAGLCSPLANPYTQSMGTAVIVEDADLGSLAPPLRID